MTVTDYLASPKFSTNIATARLSSRPLSINALTIILISLLSLSTVGNWPRLIYEKEVKSTKLPGF